MKFRIYFVNATARVCEIFYYFEPYIKKRVNRYVILLKY